MDFLSGCAMCCAFIGSFYVWPRDRRFLMTALTNLRTAALDDDIYVNRNSDATIVRRSASFAGVTAASVWFLWRDARALAAAAGDGHHSPLFDVDGRQVATSVLSIVALFAGHIIERGRSLWAELPTTRSETLLFLRDIVLCPIGEEIFFRGVLFVVLRRRSEPVRVLLAALMFALSHTHHVVAWAADAYRRRQSRPAQSAESEESDTEAELLCATERDSSADADDSCLVRASWRAAGRLTMGVVLVTGVFGLLSGYYYTRVCKGNVVAISAVHALCNFLGPPTFQCFRPSGGTTRNTRATAWRTVAAVGYVVGALAWLSAVCVWR